MANNETTAAIKDNGESISDHVEDAVHAGQGKAAAMKHRLVEVKGVVVDQAQSMVQTVRNAIITHPLIAVGVAFGVGYAAMRLVRRRG